MACSGGMQHAKPNTGGDASRYCNANAYCHPSPYSNLDASHYINTGSDTKPNRDPNDYPKSTPSQSADGLVDPRSGALLSARARRQR